MSINIATTVTTLLLASITLPLTLTHPACAQFNSSATVNIETVVGSVYYNPV